VLLSAHRVGFFHRRVEVRRGCLHGELRVVEVLLDRRMGIGQDELARSVLALDLREDVEPDPHHHPIGRIRRIEALVDAIVRLRQKRASVSRSSTALDFPWVDVLMTMLSRERRG